MEQRRHGCQHRAKTKSAWIQPLTTTVFHAVYPKHFVGQALRRAFLCANDEFSGQSYEHRKQWVVDKLAKLANVFLSIFVYELCRPQPSTGRHQESSGYTSIQARIQTYQSPTPEPNQGSSQTTQTPVKLIDFIGHEHKNQPEGIAFSFSDYRELVDWTGQAVRDDKTGAIAESLPSHFVQTRH